MTPRERVIASLEHRQPDAVPYHVTFTAPARAALARHLGDADFETGLGNCLTVLRTRVPYRDVEGRPGVQEDEFGVQWDKSIDADIGTVCNTALTRETLKVYKFPDPRDPRRFAHFPVTPRGKQNPPSAAQNPPPAATNPPAGERFVIASLAFTMFERAWTLAGMETVLMAMADDPSFANGLFDRILEFDMEVTRAALSRDIDGMRFGDDWGQQRGLIMGPVLWRKYILPRVSKLYRLVKASGKRVFIHSCGQIEELFPDLIDAGVDVFNPFQPEVMNVESVKARYGPRLTFFGGISTQRTLPYGSEADVREEVKRLIALIGKGGGYIAAPAHDIPRDAKPENVAAMLEALRNQ